MLRNNLASSDKSVFETTKVNNDSKNIKSSSHTPSFSSTETCNCNKAIFFEKTLFDIFMANLSRINDMGLIYPPIKFFVKKLSPPNASPELINSKCEWVINFLQKNFSTPKNQPTWSELTQIYKNLVLKNGHRSNIGDSNFQEELESLIGSTFIENNKAKLLPDGPASFGKRYRLLDKNPKRIYVSSFEIQNDGTGVVFCKKLASLAKKGADVRVLLDKEIISLSDIHKTLSKMEKSGVKIALWKDPANPLNVLHSKIFIADDQAILGGTNYSDCYSHKFRVKPKTPSSPNENWRDTDILVKGPAVIDTLKIFAELWNESVTTISDKIKPESIKLLDETLKSNPNRTPRKIKESEERLNIFPRVKVKNVEVAATLNYPGVNFEKDGNMIGMLKLIWGAEKQIDIENAYYIRTPFFSEALINAINRGVKVRILTNSLDSLDEKAIVPPMYNSLHELIENGAEVYIKSGSTLHSKFMQVDDKYTWVGSYNLHPRSVRFDREVGYFVKSSKFAKGVKSVFEKDISPERALKVTKISDLPRVSSMMSRFVERHFYDHL